MQADDDDATLPGSIASRGASGSLPSFDAKRYDVGPILGRGGMGEIRLARDTRIDREVAVKLMRGDLDRDLVARFFREARVQGALEHPAIVPVHDLGIDAEGVPYFVMKRLTGITLADVLDAKQPEQHELRERWPRRLLLRRFVDICLAIDFAHARGVVHRDIKPANLMLGDFGEAYVLDWGLAKIADDIAPISKVQSISGSELGHTEAGQMLGTPGYMAPEQMRGEPVDARADVFGLGCVLYEILAEVPALPRGIAALEATLAAVEHRPSLRPSTPEVPPELDDLCARATAATAGTRPSARQLGEAVQRYLDGDRDLERRRELAARHARTAAIALATERNDQSRATAMREAAHALVLDPANATAKDVLTTVLLDTPEVIPAGALVAADAERSRSRRAVIRLASRGYLFLAITTSVLFLLPLHHVWPVILAIVIALGTSLAMHQLSRRPLRLDSRLFIAALILNCILLTMPGLVFGTLLVFPMFLIGSLGPWLSQPSTFPPWIVVAVHFAAFAVVFLLELTGVLPATFHVRDGALALSSWVIDLTPFTTVMIISFSIVVQIVNTSVVALSSRRAQEQAQNAVHAQRWHLQQVLPQQLEPPADSIERDFRC